MALSTAQKYGIGAGLLGLYALSARRESRGSQAPFFYKDGRKYFGSSPSLIGLNAQPGASGFHGDGATFSVWTMTTEGPAAISGKVLGRSVAIAPTAIGDEPEFQQQYIRKSPVGTTAGIPYTRDYDRSLPVLRFDVDEEELLELIRSYIFQMLVAARGLQESLPNFGPLVLTSGAPPAGTPEQVAIAEFDFDGVDPRRS